MDVHDYPWISMDINGLSMDDPWMAHGKTMNKLWLSKDSSWILHGMSMAYPWKINPWIIHGLSMEYPWMSKDNPWKSLDLNGILQAGGTSRPCWGSSQHIPGEPLGCEIRTRSFYRKWETLLASLVGETFTIINIHSGNRSTISKPIKNHKQD